MPWHDLALFVFDRSSSKCLLYRPTTDKESEKGMKRSKNYLFFTLRVVFPLWSHMAFSIEVFLSVLDENVQDKPFSVPLQK